MKCGSTIQAGCQRGTAIPVRKRAVHILEDASNIALREGGLQEGRNVGAVLGSSVIR